LRSASAWIIGFVSSPIGVVALALLDSTPLFSLPGGIDAVVLVLSAHQRRTSWAVAALATAGSLAGAALTFWMGRKIGEQGLDRYVSARRLKRVRDRVHRMGAIELAVLDLIPPPFPFTPFILGAGALDVDSTRFFATLTACRLARFGGEALLAVIYGQRILAWFDSDSFRNIVVGISVLAVVLTVASIAKLVRSSRRAGPPATSR